LNTLSKKLGIKSWSASDRPREKLLMKGPKALSDAELIAILFRTGTNNLTALDLSKLTLQKVGQELSKLATLTIPQLTEIKGLGEAKAIALLAALELGRRRKDSIQENYAIKSSQDAYNYVYPLLADLNQENFYVLLLNRAHIVIKAQQISIGGVSGTIVDLKIIFKNALEYLASSIIICHNHPSGNLKPSNADIDITNKVKEGGKILDIQVLDHLIFTNDAYFSFADEGIL
jgi:DNA repair protein RadC